MKKPGAMAAPGFMFSLQHIEVKQVMRTESVWADVNSRDPNGYTAMHHAASRGDNEMIMFLVERGGDVTAISRRGQTVADMANAPAQRLRVFPETIALLQRLGSGFNPKPK